MKLNSIFLFLLAIIFIIFIGCGDDNDDDNDNGPDINIIRITNSAGTSDEPSITWTGSELCITWEDDRDGIENIYFTRVDLNGNKISDDIKITDYPVNTDCSYILWNGNCHSVLFLNDYLFFTKLNQSGTKLISDVYINNNLSDRANLTWNGSDYGITYQTGYNQLSFARLNNNGAIEESINFDHSNSSYEIKDHNVAWSGNGYGVVCGFELWGPDFLADVYFASINSDVDDIDIYKINDISTSACNPVIVWADDKYGIFWADINNSDHSLSTLYLSQIDYNGNKIADDSIISIDNIDIYYTQQTASAVWTGSNYAIAWCTFIDHNSWPGIYFTQVDSDGNRMNDIISITGEKQPFTSNEPSMVWTGNKYAIAFADDRNGNYEIYLALIEF
jgi:hypothetical protein